MNNSIRRFWSWLMTPDSDTGYTSSKLIRLLIRIFLFACLVTLISAILMPTPVGGYLKTWWGSAVLVLLVYIPFIKFLNVDTFIPNNLTKGSASKQEIKPASRLERRRQKNQFAGIKKSPPKLH